MDDLNDSDRLGEEIDRIFDKIRTIKKFEVYAFARMRGLLDGFPSLPAALKRDLISRIETEIAGVGRAVRLEE